MKKTDYKKLYKKYKKLNLRLESEKIMLVSRLSESTRVILVIRDLLEKYIPKKKIKSFKEEFEKEMTNKRIEDSIPS